MTEQLAFLLDDSLKEDPQPFDIENAKAKHLPGRVGFADVLAIIPCDV
ncbi:hypothetical protein I6G76_01520 (plasmid) [Bacillus cereus]|nr:hypothetical protein [Bacillus cereus]AJI25987.1 hypothetical protein BF28_5810 [Bacillus cereus E33L]QQA19005.1 hypothetical protein I6G76_01520 [Bacillus cereus]